VAAARPSWLVDALFQQSTFFKDVFGVPPSFINIQASHALRACMSSLVIA